MSKETMAARLTAAEELPWAVALRKRSYELLATGDAEDGPIVDVGCGTGRAVSEVGQRAIGIDVSPEMVALAKTRYPGADFRLGDATALPLPDASVYGYRADKLLHALPDPVAALREAARVLKPGGRIVVIGQDWDGILIEPGDGTSRAQLVHERASTVRHPRIARNQHNLLRDAGFREVQVEGHLPLITGTFAESFGVEVTAPERLLVAVPIFLASGVI